MATKSILLGVADPKALLELKEALGGGWETSSASSEEEVRAQLEKRPFDALVVDFNLGSPDASELLNYALEKYPQTVRFLLSYEADLALVAAKVLGSAQILPKPFEAGSFKNRIESGVNEAGANQSATAPVPSVEAAPTIPAVYSEVIKAFDLPGVNSQQVGEIIAGDAALTTELLRLSRSAYMGLPRNLTDPVEAVESLGLETVKALVLALRFLAEHSHLKAGYLSVDQLWQHSANVAQMARDLVLFETKDRTLASQALAAGLLHDLGKVVLATNFDDLYGRVHSLARKQPVALWEIEKEMFGANHGEIGACLVGMWNLPKSIVEATASHHEPPLGESDQLTPLAAVHIADVLEHQLRPSEEFRVGPIINTTFLNELGLLERLPVWRATLANRGPAPRRTRFEARDSEPIVSELENDFPPSQAGHSSAATRTASSGPGDEQPRPSVPALFTWQRGWIYAGAAAGILLLLAFWFQTEPTVDETAPVYARTAPTSAAPVGPSTVLETVPETSPQATPAIPVPEPQSATNIPAVPQQGTAQPAPQPIPAVVSQPSTTNVPAPSLPAKLPSQETVQPDFRLAGIIYTRPRPSAILNGKTVYVGDRIDGATVLSIGQTELTLRVNGERKTYTLR